MAGATLGFLPGSVCLVPQLSKDRACAAAALTPWFWAQEPLHPSQKRLTHLGWAVDPARTAGQQQQLSPASPFQKNNRKESNSGERPALQALMESQGGSLLFLFSLMLIYLFLAVLSFH